MPVPLFAVAVGLGVATAAYLRGRAVARTRDEAVASEDATREDEPEETVMDPYRVPEEYQDLVDATLGAPYWSGKGSPRTTLAAVADGIDCSGLVGACWAHLGFIEPTAPDRRATSDYTAPDGTLVLSYANICDPIEAGEQEPGDLAIYPNHVALCVSWPDAAGQSYVLSASGGTSRTKGDDPNARVKLFTRETYRRDFVTWGRLKPAYRA